MTKVGKLLSELIALPSVNPAFLTRHDPRAGEQRVADFLAATAARAGLDVEFQEVFPRRGNLLARLAPSSRHVRKRILLAPHLDTVGGESPMIFQPRERQGRLHGRGACDTKGSIAAMLAALIELARSPQRPRDTEIIFAGLVDEENAQAGSRALIAKGFKADLAIVGEPTNLQVVTAHKGDLWLQLETRGKAAHGSRPDLGRNAVHGMARIVDLFETAYAAALKRRRHPLLGYPTVSVGTIAGGSQPNIVPDCCRISIDRRTLPGETEAGVRREIKALLRKRQLSATLLNIRNAPCPAMEANLRLPLVKMFMQAAGQRKPVGVHYFCDAAVLASGGIPSVVFGPGDIAQAHTTDEWISLRQLEQGARRLFRFLQSLP
ncbi:MAG TPA: M20/M25/M40 family metallo-hydrolase [Verrucomicrobiae bacterium]|nr:M20/M25/M40 family metallo-hydrolase [Verrucomicrobiae bacterium]